MAKSETVEFYDVKTRKKVLVPASTCSVEKFSTSRGERTRIVGVIQDNPSDPSSQRKLSKLCAKDFTL